MVHDEMDPDIVSVDTTPTSISVVGIKRNSFTDRFGHPVWNVDFDEIQPPVDLVPIVVEHQATIEQMCGLINNLNVVFPQVVDKLNYRFRPALWEHA